MARFRRDGQLDPNTVTITDAASGQPQWLAGDPARDARGNETRLHPVARQRRAGVALTPAVSVAAKDQFGNTFTGDSTSTVTLTLSRGTFAGGGTTATATVSGGVATFSKPGDQCRGATTP